MDNKIAAAIPAATLAQAQQHLDALRTLLAPYLVPLTPEERQAQASLAPTPLRWGRREQQWAASPLALFTGLPSLLILPT